MAEKIIVEIDLDTGTISSAFGKIEQATQKAADNVRKKFNKALNTDVGPALKNIGLGFLGVGAAATAAAIKVSRAAAIQEDAINQLNTSLRLAGSFSEEASRGFQDFASAIQQTSTFGDEVILQQAALARNFTTTNEEAKKLTKAAIELSAATGMTLEGSVRNLGKTFSGLTGELGESLPGIKNLSAEALKSGAALDFVLKRFGGAAQAQLNTFSGALQASENAFGDLLEKLGFFITKSPIAIELIKSSKEAFEELSGFIKGIDLQTVTNGFFEIGTSIIKFVGAPVELVSNIFKAAQGTINFFVANAIKNLGILGGGVATLIQKFSPNSELAASLKTFQESSTETFVKVAGDSKEAFEKILDFETTEGLIQRFDALKQRIEERGKINVAPDPEQTKVAVEQNKSFLDGLIDDLQPLFKKGSEGAKTLGKNIATGIGNGVGSGFAAFGQALVSGENALDAFAKSFLGTLGQMMVQQGTAFILQGLGFNVIPGLQASGSTLIGVGSTLAIFGGALSALSGGGSGAPSAGATGAGGGGGDPGTFNSDLPLQETEEAAPSTIVNVNFDGVIDSEDGARRMADLLNTGFEKEGIVLKRGLVGT